MGLLAAVVLAGCGSGNSVEELLQTGNEAFAERNYAEAREYYLRGLEIDSKDRDLLLACGKAYRQDFMLDSAIYYFKRADLMQRDDREINEQIREVAKALGDWQNAIDAIETLARLDGTMEPYHIELADLRLKNNQPGRAYYHARNALLAGPDVPGLYIQTASMAVTYDSVEVAIEILDAAIAKYGPMEQFVVNRAMLLAYTGDLGQAEAALRSVIDQSQSPQPALKMNLANILAAQPQRAKKEEALQLYEEIRELVSRDFPVDSLMQVLRDELD
jgi:tetratricopeptide (TPR) repeat protein